MTGTGISVPVVVLLRRLFNAISTLSVSKEYILQRKQRKALEAQQRNSSLHSASLSPHLELDPHSNSEYPSPIPPSHSSPKPHRHPRQSPPPPKPQTREDPEVPPESPDIIHQLLHNPVLFDPLRTPRYPIVLCHGLYGFDQRGPSSFPSMRMHYWANVLKILRQKIGAQVVVTSVPGTGSIASRAEALHQQLETKARGRGINFLAHSMGGLDCRHLISHIKPSEYVPLSLTSISTPHRGSPFMDWCTENIGIGKLKREEFIAKSTSFSFSQLPSTFTSLILNLVDSPAYANLRTSYLTEVFNPQTPDDPRVKYFSVAARAPGVNIWHPFWLPKMVLDGVEARERQQLRESWESGTSNDPLWKHDREWGNDGLVTVQSAKWGEFLGIMEGCDHWEIRGARGIEFGVDLPAIPAIGLSTGSSNSSSSSQGDGWGLMDWGRFVRAWKKEEKSQRDAAMASKPASDLKDEQIKEKTDEALVKNSTDKASSAFDWLLEQVPSVPLLGGPKSGKTQAVEDAQRLTKAEVDALHGEEKKDKTARKKAELASKADLERFYVALSRKMYDEGL
ncbi:Ubiquitin-related modifier 1 [Mycena indigotica]|uniref:Ubiquitin-related modifier 1 n=1 Tax=Mycena indigotica TaxID=2126181 RepID=A0A8H6S5M2_9AGAR|nr:Ubiquitin-related modifier 1 [Mycena indigotica]KAF7292852.1 Ubiquitin-related modifier 1 [Mycena indigotica]